MHIRENNRSLNWLPAVAVRSTYDHIINCFIIILLLIVSNHQPVFSQEEYKRITISGDLELIKLSENAYLHVSYAYLPEYGRFTSNGLVFINQNKALLFDTPTTDSLTEQLVKWIRDSMKLKLVGFIPNHWHNDCMGGLGYLKKLKIESYANQITIDIARSRGLPLPDHGFKDSLQLQLGDKWVKCYYPGPAHTIDNIVVWIPSERMLFAGCMIKSLESQNLGNTSDADLKSYPHTIEKVLKMFPEAKIVIPGHGAVGGQNLIFHTLQLSGE